MKILYIENHETFTRVVVDLFLRDHEVSVQPTMASARSLMNEEAFDLLIVDYDLDDGKGAEFVEEISRIENRPKIIASSSREDGNEMLLEAGADAVCSKMEFDQIGSVIDGLFSDSS